MEHELLQIRQHLGEGLGGEYHGGDWCVLILNYLPRLAAHCVQDMQKHLNTDECFVLLNGQAVLFVAGGEERPDALLAYPMENGKVYCIPKGTWHTQAMSADAKLLLMENSGTVTANSPRCPLTEMQKTQLQQEAARWLSPLR